MNSSKCSRTRRRKSCNIGRETVRLSSSVENSVWSRSRIRIGRSSWSCGGARHIVPRPCT
eukprot:430847-Rhodomonas_salina.4